MRTTFLTRRRIHAGREQLRRGEDDGRVGLEFLEASEMAPADVAFVGGDAAHVVGMLSSTRSAFRLLSSPPHLVGVFLVHAEDDGLGEAVGLLEEIREVPRDGLGARSQRETRSKSGV